MGAPQKNWLKKQLQHSRGTWNVLAQQVMMARVDRMAGPGQSFSMDQWPGYEAERQEMVRFFHEAKIRNPVVLTGDIHTNYANHLVLDCDRPDSPVVATELVGTSITSGGDGVERPGNHASILQENPFVKFYNGQRGYVRCELTPSQWKADYRTLDFVSRPGGSINTRQSFVIENGRPGLNPL